MDHYKYVISEHLNHYGTLYGGNLLNWIDFKNHVLDLEYYSICSTDNLNC